ncbi:unnamed protein product [Xylocopa violacea]|uniref:phospholipase A1 n=1 Tax=Xylocopa violacea TaxID=135666 RepID=A0ABP1NRA4_XYLVO
MAATMNANVILLFLFLPTLLAISIPKELNKIIPFPDVNGVVHQVELDYEELTSEQISLLSKDVTTTSFTLFTRSNPRNGQLLVLNDINSVKRSNFNPKKPTIMVTHGWTANGNSGPCPGVRDAFLSISDCNVIVFDWSSIADNLVYSVVAKSVPRVAQHVSDFVNFLRVKAGLNVSNMKMIGHSLGAHVMGLGAGGVKKYALVGEVIALDAAKPLFEHQGPNGRVDSSQARVVQAIHTCAGLLGIDYNIGTSDFYANDGRHQPGCGTDAVGSCAHGRSYQYYIESITNPRGFVGKSSNNGLTALMGGAHLDLSAKGTYRFQTRSSAPFATSH